MSNYLIKNANLVNEGKIQKADVLIEDGKIGKICYHNEKHPLPENTDKDKTIIDAKGLYLIPGIIDDHVHFREPGLTHKADILSESKAAIAGGVTSYMEMPNTIPNTTTNNLLEDKFKLASEKSLANYSFYIGATNDNIDEISKANAKKVCGIKVFMGSSTGNMLVDDNSILKEIFSLNNLPIAAHCEDEEIINKNTILYKDKYGDNIHPRFHKDIRSKEACYKASSKAIDLATKHNTRLHILHISTAKEIELFTNAIPLKQKRITAEVCPHHLWFDSDAYETKGTLIKLNPSIKTTKDKEALLKALLNNKIDLIGTDHAPHNLNEKQNSYFNSASGTPSIQFSLLIMLELYHQKKISLEKIVEKMCHAPADCFNISKRGYIKEGYFADMVLIDLNKSWTLGITDIISKCAWSPFEGQIFNSKVTHTFVNGHLAYNNGTIDEAFRGKRLIFNR